MTPNKRTIRALREARNLSLRELSETTGLNRGYLSRLERGYIAKPAPEKLLVIAEVLAVSPHDIDTPGEPVTAPTVAKSRTPRATEIRPGLPNPASTEGELFAYTPAEAATFLPLSARELRERAYRRELDHGSNGRRIFFTGLHIRAAMQALTVPKQRAKSA